MKNKIQEINISESTALLPDDVVPVFTAQDFHEKFFCQWKYDADERTEAWETSCGNDWQFNEGTPAENRITYCPYCGRKIEVIK